MDRTDRAALELREMDELAAMKSPVHFMHPLSKLIITISYILVTVSFGKYELSGLLVMVLYPLFVFSIRRSSVHDHIDAERGSVPAGILSSGGDDVHGCSLCSPA